MRRRRDERAGAAAPPAFPPDDGHRVGVERAARLRRERETESLESARRGGCKLGARRAAQSREGVEHAELEDALLRVQLALARNDVADCERGVLLHGVVAPAKEGQEGLVLALRGAGAGVAIAG